MNQDVIVQMLMEHRWVALMALAIGAAVRVLKQDVRLTPTVPAAWRPWLAVGLGLVGGVLERLGRGIEWQRAMAEGVVSGIMAIGGHELFVESLNDGHEVVLFGKGGGE